jgi:hypothetical protein
MATRGSVNSFPLKDNFAALHVSSQCFAKLTGEEAARPAPAPLAQTKTSLSPKIKQFTGIREP